MVGFHGPRSKIVSCDKRFIFKIGKGLGAERIVICAVFMCVTSLLCSPLADLWPFYVNGLYGENLLHKNPCNGHNYKSAYTGEK